MKPMKMKDALVSIAGTDYGAEASSVTLTPTTPVTTWKGLKPTATYSSAGNPTWALDMMVGTDWDDAASLARYLFEHVGEEVALEFRPKSGGAGITANVILIPGAIGGQVDTDSEASVSLPVTGQPTFTAAV
ncbi:hypothetical protein [Demequina capsici]|uniref:Phage tail protein n=1 Tax=Demequina capsici TaxID=3075620 RepID=A0AA96J7J0_9MICO|nr:hypothetical protein [Demequina sp. OYTSA14]WNM25242.1 hypothetical protein RN606_03585 [Demequina sp. OYTSA14]